MLSIVTVESAFRGLKDSMCGNHNAWAPLAILRSMNRMRSSGQSHHEIIRVIRLQKPLYLFLLNSSTNLRLSRMVLDVHLRGLVVVLHEGDLFGSDRNVLHVTLSLRKSE